MFINGEKADFAAEMTVAALLEQRGYDCSRVAVEINGVIVPRTAFVDETLVEGDKIEIVTFVGGG